MTMADQGVQLHPDSYSVVIAKANQVLLYRHVQGYSDRKNTLNYDSNRLEWTKRVLV